MKKHKHDWNRYGKCTECGKWNTQDMFSKKKNKIIKTNKK